MSPMNLAFIPIYIKLWTHEGKEPTRLFISNTLTWFLVGTAFVTCLTLLCSRDIIVVLASRRYMEAYHLLPIIIPSLMLYATHIFLNAGMMITKRTGLMAGLVMISAVANLVANLYLIPRFGTVGAAYATLLSYSILIALMAWMNQAILPIRPDWYLIVCSFIAGTFAWLAIRHIHVEFAIFSLGIRSYSVSFALLALYFY